jgi:hypothetical protein
VLEEADVLIGDVDENGSVENADAQLLLKYILGSKTLTSSRIAKADADSSGKVDLLDVVNILKIVNS